MAINNVNLPNGVFVEETSVWDQIGNLDTKNPEDLRLLITRLYQNINLISIALNLKDTGIFDNSQEFITGMNYFPDPTKTAVTSPQSEMRPVYRTTLIMGALTNAGTTTTAHNINPNSSFRLVRCYGAATDPVGLQYTPIPNSDINVYMDATNIVLTTTTDYSAYSEVLMVIEYLKW